MAQNDMYVVMYKIICYLYDCMKKGEKPDIKEYDHRAMMIPETYWAKVMIELIDHCYVKGFLVARAYDPPLITPADPSVTMEGVAFAQENSMMSKARQFLVDVKASVPFI